MPNTNEPNGSDDSLLGLSNKNSSLNNQQPNVTQKRISKPLQKMAIFSVKKQSVPTNQPQQTLTTTTPTSTPHKKSKLWIIALIIIILVGLGVGGYFVYQKYFSSTGKANTALEKFQKGPSLTTTKKDINSVAFSSDNLVSFTQHQNGNIYADYYLFSDKNDQLVFSPFGGKLIDASQDGTRLLLYYDKAPEKSDKDSTDEIKAKDLLKDVQNNYFVVDLNNNNMYAIGNYVNKQKWVGDNMFYLVFNNDVSELWRFNPKTGYATSWGGANYDVGTTKLVNLKGQTIDYALMPNTNIIYFITDYNAPQGKYLLNTYDINTQRFTTITQINSSTIVFSPSGYYYVLNDYTNNNMTIYNSQTNEKVAEINKTASLGNVGWSKDETQLYYFADSDPYYTVLDKSLESEGTSYYSDLVKYTIENKKLETIAVGKKINLTTPINFMIDNINKLIYLYTNQNSNIYSIKL
jgi:hypothetical protein